uniref:GAIN-B domain-containing protein n=1 Tax=Ciona savignyi TaxID=51511 RepID=H2YZV2_CIOSA
MNTTGKISNYLENTAFEVVSLGNQISDLNQGSNGINRLQFPSAHSSAQDNETDWINEAGSIAVPFSPDAATKTTFVFAVYKNLDTLLGNSFDNGLQTNENQRNSTNKEATDSSNATDRYLINSHVISASIKPLPDKLLKQQKVKFLLKHKETTQRNSMRCVFWMPKLEENSSAGHWASDGCTTLRSNSTHTSCECDHLTNFAILMDVVGVELGDTDNLVLTYITWAGCSMSVVCLVMCVLFV